MTRIRPFARGVWCLLLCLCLLTAGPPAGTDASAPETVPIAARGVDVSAWQGEVDWEAVKADGIDFVILRAGTGLDKDLRFEENYAAARAAGLDVGCYYYSYALSAADAASEARQLLGWLDGKRLDYPVYFDMEDPSQQDLSNEERTEMCLTFVRLLQQEGWCAGVYSYKYWFENRLDLAALEAKGEIWWAHWPASGRPDIDYSRYGLWQYASDGRVNGIYGDADMDVAFRDYPAWMAQNGLNGYPLPDPADPQPGDVNGDGRVNTTDARLTLQYVAGRAAASQLALEWADVDASGAVDTTDARLILQYAAGRIHAFPPDTDGVWPPVLTAPPAS